MLLYSMFAAKVPSDPRLVRIIVPGTSFYRIEKEPIFYNTCKTILADLPPKAFENFLGHMSLTVHRVSSFQENMTAPDVTVAFDSMESLRILALHLQSLFLAPEYIEMFKSIETLCGEMANQALRYLGHKFITPYTQPEGAYPRKPFDSTVDALVAYQKTMSEYWALMDDPLFALDFEGEPEPLGDGDDAVPDEEQYV